MSETVVCIDRRYRGPPDIGNGGYVCGRVAAFIDGPAEVTLRHPPPLGQPLSVERAGDRTITLRYRDKVIAEARATALDLDVPSPPSYQEAVGAGQRPYSFDWHPFPTCFVCGPTRDPVDGIGIVPVPYGDLVVSPWVPGASLADGLGHTRTEFLWAVLDCPGGIAVMDSKPLPVVLGKITADVSGHVEPGERCVVIGWVITREGRKHTAGTALFSESGGLVGRARAVWIEPKAD